jgi:hypothetical protein
MTTRERARLTIKLPSGDQIDIPVLTKVIVVDPNGQETEQHIENTSSGNREVHVDKVTSSKDSSATIDVERIDVWKVHDDIEHGQDIQFLFDNKTGGDTTPPSFTAHLKRHIVRYYKDPNNHNDSGAWIDSELIDSFSVLDQRGQEDIFTLDNPARDDDAAQANPNDPAIAQDPPYRTDPYQNIVDFNDEVSTGGGPGTLKQNVTFVIQWTRGDNEGFATNEVAVTAGLTGDFTIGSPYTINSPFKSNFSGIDFGPFNDKLLGHDSVAPPDTWNSLTATATVAGFNALLTLQGASIMYGPYNLDWAGTTLTAVSGGTVLHPVSMTFGFSGGFAANGTVHYESG